MTSCFLRLHIQSIFFTSNMKLFPIIVVIGFVYTIKSVAGNATTKADCMGPGVKGNQSVLSCTLLTFIRRGITWVRPDGKTAILCTTNCFPAIPKFEGVYKSFFDTHAHNTLIIESFNPRTDVGQWLCIDVHNGMNSTCYKQGTVSGASVGVISTFVLIFWVTAILATGLQVTTNTFPI